MDFSMVAWKLDVWHPRGTYWNSAPDCISPFSPTGGVKGYGPEAKEFVGSRFSSSLRGSFFPSVMWVGCVWM